MGQWELGIGLTLVGIGLAFPYVTNAYKELCKTKWWLALIGGLILGIGIIVSFVSFIYLASS